MKYPKITLLVFILWIIGFFIMYKVGSEESKIENKLLKNNIEIKGIIESIKISKNHCFAIIQVKNLEANRKIFNQVLNRKYFPYVIKNNQSEIYAHICDLENIGDTITLNSNEKIIKIKDNSTGKISERDIGIVKEETDMEYIKLNTILNK